MNIKIGSCWREGILEEVTFTVLNIEKNIQYWYWNRYSAEPWKCLNIAV